MSVYRPDRFRRTASAEVRRSVLPSEKQKAKKKAPQKPAAPIPPGSLTADTLTVCVHVPCKALRPNAGHGHWVTIHKARKAAKARASLLTRSLVGPAPALLPTGYSLIYHTKNQWDDDNAVAAVKSYLDGIADSLGINDRTLRLGTVSHRTNSKTPHVEILIHLASPTTP